MRHLLPKDVTISTPYPSEWLALAVLEEGRGL